MGENSWRNLMGQLKEGENAIFVIRTAGHESFKGSGFVRGGIYDRVLVHQEGDTFSFRDLDALNLYGVQAKGAPRFTEAAIFIIRSNAFSAAYPWSLSFLGNHVDQSSGAKTFVSFATDYWLPGQYLQGGRPTIVKPDPGWLKIWKSRALEISLFALLLVAVTVVYAVRDKLTRRSTHKNKWPVNGFKYTFWMIFIVWVGFIMMAQPSITQVLTWLHSLLFKWEWTLFLSDPFIFLFWVFIFITIFVFGRGLFCGWTCPFGSIQEIIHKVAGAVGLGRFQFQLPQVWHDRLKWIKYAIFIGLVIVSLFSMGLAEVLAEVEAAGQAQRHRPCRLPAPCSYGRWPICSPTSWKRALAVSVTWAGPRPPCGSSTPTRSTSPLRRPASCGSRSSRSSTPTVTPTTSTSRSRATTTPSARSAC